MTAATAPTVEPGTAHIDVATLLQTVDNDRELVAQLFDMFLTDAPGQISRMRIAIEADLCATLQAEAHSLKGAAGSVRATIVAADALLVETAARNNDLAAATVAFRQLEVSIAEMPAAVSRLMESI